MAKHDSDVKQRIDDQQLWVETGPDVGQPKFKDDWDADEYNRLRAQSPGVTRWKKIRLSYDRDEQEAFTDIDREKFVKRFQEEWVNVYANEMQRMAWFQSIKTEILTKHRPSEGIQLMAQMYGGDGQHEIKKGKRKGQLRPRWEVWLESFRQAETQVKKLFSKFVNREPGQLFDPAALEEEKKPKQKKPRRKQGATAD